MRQTIRIFLLVTTLLFGVASGAWAVEELTHDGTGIKIYVEKSPSNGGTVSIDNVTGSEENPHTVTLNVSPADGYSVSANLITAEPIIVLPTSPAPRRAPGLMEPLVVSHVSGNLYSFVLPSDYNAAFVTVSFYEGTITTTKVPIRSLDDITHPEDATITYEIIGDIDAAGNTSLGDFKGTLDGGFHKIYNLSEPLFTSTSGDAVIRNITFEAVSIDVSGNAGAVTASAGGNTRIYNIGILPVSIERDAKGNITGFNGSSVKGTENVGGIVGKLEDNAHVINCYSYATITGGNNVGGIVGNNTGTTTAASITTMVMNCMFYGDIIGGTTVSPVYGGNNINNLQGGLNTFNYYAYNQLKTKTITDGKYNCALSVEEKYLNRFEYYRLLLNSNKKLAAFYATGSHANANQMAKWVLETADRSIKGREPYPYPILKKQGYYPSIINPDIENAPDSATVGRNHGGKLEKTLSVTISGTKTDGGQAWPTGASITTPSLTLQRTDKDFDRFNYNYDKVQLPYYNDVGTGNYTGNKVVTGWKITAITTVTGDPYTAGDYPTSGITDYPKHNYADRKSSNKDLYTVSKRVFSQGAYFDVPYGVTSITIEPYWGNAIYVADQYYDVVYQNDYKGKQGVSQTGTQVTTSGAQATQFNGQSVKTSISGLGSGTTVYDNAVVLVGNLHLDNVPSGGTVPFTMMSVDQNNDHEPDYSLIYHHKDRTAIAPIRFDFLNIPGTAQAQKPNGASLICNFTIFKTRGWFEVTNTSSFYSSQLEYENQAGVTKDDAPLILLGGVIDQFVSTQSSTVDGHTIYIHVGGNVWINEFGLGTHSDGSQSTPHVPVSVTGGEFPGFYLTGTYKADATVRTDNAECYISGGYFHEAAGASLEQIDGNVRWQIYNADIDNFFGGGINDAKPITGDIIVDIYNSHVKLFCGGPKFGNMQGTKKVTTTAEGCTFGKYFGAGYGGTSIAKKKYYDLDSYNWSTLQGYYTNDRGKYYNGSSTGASQISGKDYGKKGPGVATDFDYEFFVWSSGTTGARFFVKFASFSLAQCNDVSSTLKKCTVETNFYGGGNLGKVVGKATSVLEDCTVKGNVYGAGYSASLPTVEVRNAGFTKDPNFNSQSGMFEPGAFSGTTSFTWENAAAASKTLTNGQSGSDLNNHILYTGTELTGLGEVAETDLKITGTTTVGESVYGGGEESGVGGNTIVKVDGGTIGVENTGKFGYRWGNVYGGGKGKINDETAELTVSSIADLDAGLVKGNTNIEINGGTILHNVYGGGAVGSVGTFTRDNTTGMPTACDASTGLATVTINGGTIGHNHEDTGMVDGSSRGWEGNPNGTGAFAFLNQLAWVNNTNVTIGSSTTTAEDKGPTIMGSVYGGGENGHNFENGVVTVNKGTIGNKNATWDSGNIYGAGCGTDTYTIGEETTEHHNPMAGIVRGTTSITINGGQVIRSVYGGGSMGSVNGKATININGGTIGYDGGSYGNIYGGPKGNLAETEFSASVRETSVNINNAHPDDETKNSVIWGSVFGGGEAGIVKGAVVVNMEGGNVKQDVYGGGALANTNTDNWNPSGGTGGTGDWADATNKSALHTTTVNLTGGTIGNAYGGGLGRLASGTEGQTDYVSSVEAKVYGDVSVTVNGTAFTKENNSYTEENNTIYVPKTGRVFGCNNINGSPKGEVTVRVKKTVPLGGGAHSYGNYEIAAVYGGGNEAPYEPVKVETESTTDENFDNDDTKASTNVIIEGCGDTSIETVYGGGNAASTPSTKVTIHGAYEIGEVFGGGNGKDKIKHGDSWDDNEGAHVGFRAYAKDATPEQKTAAKYGSGQARVNIYGGKIHAVYGGSNTLGNVRLVAVAMLEETQQNNSPVCPMEVDEAYGGGKSAPMDGRAELQLGCIPGIGEVYGGSRNADVNNDVVLTITNGTYKRVFGGNNEGCSINGSITVNIEETGCKPIIIGQLFGGGNQAAYVTPTGKDGPTINVKSFTSIGEIYGGGYSASVTGDTHVNINEIVGSQSSEAYAGETDKVVAKYKDGNNVEHEIKVNIPARAAGKIGSIGHVYGGGYGADVIGNTNVNIATEPTVSYESGSDHEAKNVDGANITGSVYGGGYGNVTNVTGDVVVNVGHTGATDAVKNNITIGQDVYGGSALGKVNKPSSGDTTDKTTKVNLYAGKITRNVYGGGEGKLAEGNNPAIPAEVWGDTEVKMYGDMITGALFGGCNKNGVLKKDAQVTVLGGKIGTEFDGTNTKPVPATIPNLLFGGGKGAETKVLGKTTVNIGTKTLKSGSTTEYEYNGTALIYGNVYGGSENGTVGAVDVNLYANTIYGNVFGGGYSTDDNATAATTVNVLLDGTEFKNFYSGTGNDAVPLTGQIFGCNNLKGSPTGLVKVRVKRTVGSTKPDVDRTARTTYDVAAVYGGGNQADYMPTGAEDSTLVVIEGCDLTSIKNVYGGGNAAAVPASGVTIKGSYIIDRVFGGGNGAGKVKVNNVEVDNPGAHVGYYNNGTTKTAYTKGKGTAWTILYGGNINSVFGGSNTKGDIRNGIFAVTKKSEVSTSTADCCSTLNVGQMYGAGSHADSEGDVNIILECMPEDYVDAVYGGAEEAIVNGDVTLVVTSGKFGRVFGGNNKGGSINGIVSVYVKEGGCKDLEIGELYGGGNLAPYSKYGCTYNTTTKKWDPNSETAANLKVDFTDEKYANEKYPYHVRVFVESCTSIGKIFGGGLGTDATVTGDTYINVNMMYGSVNDVDKNVIGRIGQIYGGGNAGKVKGKTTLDIGTETASEDIGVKIESGTYFKAQPTSATDTEEITDAGVYGGGLSAEVDGSTTVNIGTADQNLGTIIDGNVYGGGKEGTVTGSTQVNLCAKKANNSDTYSSVTFAEGNPGVTITGDVFGAGQGKDNDVSSALVKGNSTIYMGNGTVKGNIYGGGELASVGDTNSGGLTTINIIGGIVGDENDYVYDANSKIEHTDGGNVFAGGKGKYTTSVADWTKLGNVKSTKLTVSGGTIMSNVYGGGELGAVTGSHTDTNNKVWATEISITNGTIGTEIKNGETLEYTFGSVYGGGMGDETHGGGDVNAESNANTYVSMTGGVVKASVYGGGELAQVYGSTDVQVSGGEIGHTKVDDKQFGGATMGNVYGGGKGSLTKWDAGLIKGNTKVTINPGSNGEPKIYHNIYGGGAYGSVGTITTGSATYVPGKESVSNMPTSWVRKTGNTGVNTGTAEVYVYGGTLGVDGKENGMVFASSRGDVATPGTDGVDPNDRLAWVYDTKLVIDGANTIIKGSVYGSGENGHVFTATDIEIHNGTIGVTESDALGGANYRLRGNVYGGGCGEDTFTEGTEEKFNPLAGIVLGTTSVSIDGGTVVHNVYGAGALGSVGGKTTVTISDDAVIGVDGGAGGNVFGAARGKEGITIAGSNLANALETEVNINSHSTDNTKTGARVYGSVYGGGEAGYVKQGVVVNMNGGVVSKDVYGGGALADTQTDNWNFTSKTWAANKTSASSTTAVNLFGGQIGGDAYGGGLGRLESGTKGQTDYVSPVEAKVYGDVTVTLGKTDRSAATAFVVDKYDDTYGTHAGIVKSGRVFGCNNLNGSPQGSVTVTVNKTAKGNIEKTASEDRKKENATHSYHVAAVYGGGNLAGKTVGGITNVIINGCDVSIRQVYGGGNAARVPGTDVLVNGAYEIEQVFGGGNGKDDYTLDGGANWVINPGADVDGYTNTLLRGGLIHEAYGGSNEKGTITGSVSINTSDDRPEDCDCELDVEKLVGAGKNADVNGDLIMVLGCKPTNMTPLVFGGADNANVNGNVELTITSGTFGKVFGGNNLGGVIKGHIILNIEETGCNPIKIDELYLGGNQAAYSIYGYYNAGNEANPDIRPRTAAMYAITDPNAEGYKAPVANPAADATHSFPYAQPVLNVISCTSIGKVFGGGYGAGAAMHADPTVNINMIPGAHKTSEHQLGTIGDVFGGGNEAIVIGNTTVNIGTAETVTLTSVDDDPATTGYNEKTPFVEGARIVGDVFGGGNKANVTGNTHVNICTKEVTNSDNTTSWQKVTYGTGLAGVSIDKKADNSGGSVYGGGCSADVLGNTFVRVSDGYIFNGVFGGGYAGNVGTFDKRDKTLTTDNFDHSTHSDVCIGKPTHCVAGTGKCTVVVDGGQIGPIEVATLGMNRPEAQGGPVPQGWVWGAGQGLVEDPEKHPDTHFKSYVGSTDVTIGGDAFVLESIIGGGEFGRVFGDTKVTITGNCQIGVGEGKVANGKPVRYTDDQFVNPLTTPITSGTNGNALAECSHFPYGRDTNNDEKLDEFLPYDPYYDKYYDENPSIATSDLGPASTKNPSDGKTWIGCVFAGGSGYMPYEKEDGTGYDWCSSAGLVEGNTELIISGGHILTNVYGGNEVTNVKGKCKVTMTGGTIGVPRTVDQIIAHPLSCYLFGAGKGDQRRHFNKETNVGEVKIEITGGIIYGSVFGGGEDGHVERDVKLTIGKDDHSGPIIGTWGTSYVDGNVFGGGRGFAGDAYTAGNVAGCVDLDIKGGNILGSIYGGGRLGSVGYGLYPSTEDDTKYGAMRPDNTGDDGSKATIPGFKRGYVDVEISGGTIGNRHEYIIPSEANTPSSLNIANIATWTDANWKTWKDHNHIPLTEFDKEDYRLKHTKGGNVFAGGMGRLYQLDGITPISAVNWWKVGCVKQTKLTVKGGTIKSNVYGGGELGAVKPYVNGNTVQGGTTEIIVKNENNTQIGTEIKDGSNATQYTFGSVYGGGYGSTVEKLFDEDDTATEYDNPKYVAGLVYGDTKIDMQGGKVLASIYGGGETASVNGSTDVAVSGGEVGKAKEENKQFGGPTMGNVYGGGSGHPNIVRCGRILKNSKVTISGADTKIYHNVYGGGAYGTVGDFVYDVRVDEATQATKVFGVSDLNTENTGKAEVIITGGTIGIDGHENGMIFGSSRGDVNKPGERDDHTAWVYDAFVTIGTQGSSGGPQINGSVYGSGENGHTFNDAVVNIHSGTIGIPEGSQIINDNGTPDDKSDDIAYSGAEYPYRGNVYGGGCGTDTYTKNGKEYYNPLAGIVKGNTTVTINGGHVVRNVYGAGAMGSVGTITSSTKNESLTNGFGLSWPYKLEYAAKTGETTVKTGETTVKILGGVIGVEGKTGDVYGAARGEAGDRYEMAMLGNVRKTNVTVKDATIYGSVYGGAENGHVNEDTDVKIYSGNIARSVFGGGKGMGKYTEHLMDPNHPGTTYPSEIYSMTAGKVYGNTHVTMSGGKVGYNVYGGGDMGSVGKGNYSGGSDDYSTTGYGETLEGKLWDSNDFMESGKTNVLITGGSIGTDDVSYAGLPTGNVFGGCRGEASPNIDATLTPLHLYYPVFFVGYVNESDVKIGDSSNGNGPSILGSVYGGGQDGHVRRSTHVTINQGDIANDVFGSGSGIGKYKDTQGEHYSKASGSVTHNTIVDIKGGTIHKNVYGGGALSSVGPPKMGQEEDAASTQSLCQVNVEGGEILGDVNGASRGNVDGVINGELTPEEKLQFATCLWSEVNIKPGATVKGHVFGGGEAGLLKHDAVVKVTGGTMEQDVYGGGDMADVNGNTSVYLTGGNITGAAYGGGRGRVSPANVPATVGGNALVDLNDGVTTGCVVDRIFGCNNVNGSPKGHVTVHVHATQNKDKNTISEKYYDEDKHPEHFDMTAVYGGGNRADYEPTNQQDYAEVIIEGCDLTSINEVYGGGYGAATPATMVRIKGTKLIENVFGGGYGDGNHTDSKAADYNPGANVGYKTNPKEQYGTGKATVELMAGRVNYVYGGSNSKGDIREGSSLTNVPKPDPTPAGCCDKLEVQQLYGGGKNALQEGGTEIVMGCMPDDWIEEIYAGAQNADVGGNVNLTITSGKFRRVFGGNKQGGKLQGSITVNIEENPKCDVPIIIGELYGGGNLAPYSIYGYNDDGTPKTSGKQIYRDPDVNVRAFTSIGNIFGGGYGANAVMVANPEVHIDEVEGGREYPGEQITLKDINNNESTVTLYPRLATAKMGVIGDVFGGGNAAKVIGSTHVYVATEEEVNMHKLDNQGNAVLGTDGKPTYEKRKVLGADIRGNVYGGGNNAEVTGQTNVQIGNRKVTEQSAPSAPDPEP